MTTATANTEPFIPNNHYYQDNTNDYYNDNDDDLILENEDPLAFQENNNYYNNNHTSTTTINNHKNTMNLQNQHAIQQIIKNTEQAMVLQYNSKIGIKNLTWLKFKKRILNINKWSKLIFIIVIILILNILISGITCIIFNFEIIESKAIYFLCGLYLFSLFPLLYFTLSAIYMENEFQLFSFLIQLLWVCVCDIFILYPIISLLVIYENNETIQKYKFIIIFLIIIPSLIIFLIFIFILIIIIPVFRSFGWKIYRKVGSSPELVSIYRIYSIFKSLIQVDLMYLTCLYVMSLSWLKFDMSPWSQIVLSIGYLISIIFTYFSLFYAVRKEIYLLQILYILFNFILPGYLIYKVIEAYLNTKRRIEEDILLTNEEILTIMTIITTVTILIRFITIIFSILVTINFRKGLKSIFEKYDKKRFYEKYFENVESVVEMNHLEMSNEIVLK
ncbi:hypothetical protein ABK040_011799 [Willaertia magna]